MRRFQFRLQSVLELREVARNQCRAQLAESFAAARDLDARQQSLDRELLEFVAMRQSGQTGLLDVSHLGRVQRYESALRGDLQALLAQRRSLEERIEHERQSLVDADRQVRVIERLRDRQLARHQQQTAAAAARELDDLARSSAAIDN